MSAYNSSSLSHASPQSKVTKTISVTSGKGGVGKSTVISNLAIHLSQQGKKVLILDGDLGMANIDIMFGIRTTASIYNVLKGERALSDIIVEIAPNVDLIPGGSGIYELQSLSDLDKIVLMQQVNALETQYDYMLIDTAPGIDDSVLYLNSAAQETVILLTPDPSSLADSYALIKMLNLKHKQTHFSVVCNQVRNEEEAKVLFRRISDVCAKFLCVRLQFKGFIPLDQDLRNATKSQQLILRSQPRSPSSFGIKRIAENISNIEDLDKSVGGLQFFWERLVGVA